MLSALTLADASGADIALISPPKREVVSVSGLAGISNLRDSKRVRPQAHGGINDGRFEDGRSIVLHGQIGSTVGITDMFAQFRIITKPMLDTLDTGPSLMKWTEDTAGLQLQRLVKLDSDVDPELSGQASMLDYQAQFFAPDPRAYSQTQTTATGIGLAVLGGGRVYPRLTPRLYASSGGGTVSITNNGTRSTPAIFRVFGYTSQAIIVNLGTGDRISLTGTVTSGSYLELDSAARTLMLGGTIDQASLIDSANSVWADIPPGTSNYQLIASDFDGSARLDVLLRDAY